MRLHETMLRIFEGYSIEIAKKPTIILFEISHPSKLPKFNSWIHPTNVYMGLSLLALEIYCGQQRLWVIFRVWY